MSQLEITSEGIPSVRQDIQSDTQKYCFDLTFSKSSDIQLLKNGKLIIIDGNNREVGNEITIDSQTMKAKFVSKRPYAVDTDYYITLISHQNVVIKRMLRFRLDSTNTIRFERLEEKGNFKAIKNENGSAS